jgi:hypothetical protein
MARAKTKLPESPWIKSPFDDNLVQFAMLRASIPDPSFPWQENDDTRPMIFIEREMTRIKPPGRSPNVVVRETTADDRRKFGPVYQKWVAFRDHGTPIFEGLLLEDWDGIAQDLVAAYETHDIRTVEALAALSDGALPGMPMGARQLRDKARVEVDAMKKRAEVEDLNRRSESQDQRIAELQAKLDALDAKVPSEVGRPVGRPRKNGAADALELQTN